MPQIEVEEVKNPDLDAQIMAERLAYSLDRGRHYRRAGYYILRKAMDAGARGVEISVAGKVTSQRARTQIFRAGTMKKSGTSAKLAVDKGVAQCIQKSGVMGVVVLICRPNFKMGDEVTIHHEALAAAQKKIDSEKVKTKAELFLEKKESAGDLEIEEEEIFEDVEEQEEDIKEISLEPKIDKEDEA